MSVSASHGFAGRLLTDLSSGLPLVAGTVTCATALVVGSSAVNRSLLPGWGDPLNVCLYACLYLAPISAASAAAHAGWLWRSGVLTVAVTAPDGRWRALKLASSSTWVWSMASYAVLVAVVMSTVDVQGPWSASMLLLPLQAVVLITVSVATGAALGAKFTALWVPAAVAIALFALLDYLDITQGLLDRFSPTYSGIVYSDNRVPNTLLLLGCSTTLLGVGLLVTAGLRVTERRATAFVTAAAAAVVLLAGGLMAGFAGPGDLQYRTGGDPRCLSNTGVRLCVFAESEPQLAPMTAALARARAAALPLFDVPHQFFEPNVQSAQLDPHPVDVPPANEPGGQSVRAVMSLVPGADCPDRVGDFLNVSGLIFERLRPGITGPGSVHDVAQQPVAAQRAWVQPRLRRLESCS